MGYRKKRLGQVPKTPHEARSISPRRTETLTGVSMPVNRCCVFRKWRSNNGLGVYCMAGSDFASEGVAQQGGGETVEGGEAGCQPAFQAEGGGEFRSEIHREGPLPH